MTETSAALKRDIEFGRVTPILRVRDLTAAVQYYTKVLGFKVDWGFPGDNVSFFASVSRDDCHLFLSEGDQGHLGSWVWIDGKDVEALCNELRTAGANIRNPPTNYEWALEMQVEDLDGNVLRFGSEPKKDEPFGPWLDMNGDRWVRAEDGGYKKLTQKR